MKIEESEKILLHLQSHLDLSQPYDKQLTQLFAISLVNNTIIPTNKLHGRVSRWLGKHENQLLRAEKIKKVVAEALKTLESDPSKRENISLSLRISLYEKLHKERLLDLSATLKPVECPIQEFDFLKASSEKARLADQEYIYQHSALRNFDTTALPPVDEKVFNQIIGKNPDLEIFIYYFQAFLLIHPEYANSDIQERTKLLQEMIKENHALEKKLHASKNAVDELNKSAKELKAKVENLQIGQRWIFGGSYGKRNNPLDAFGPILDRLPKEAWKDIPKPLSKLIQQGDLPNLLHLAEKEVFNMLAPFKAQVQEVSELLNISRLAFLFQDPARKLPNAFQKVLPKKLAETIEYWIRQSAIVGMMELVPEGEFREIMLWASEKRPLIEEQKARQAFLDELERRIATMLMAPLDKMTSKTEGSMITLLDNIQNILTPNMQDSLAITPWLASGELWIEFERLPDNTFTLLIYPSGRLLEKYGYNAESGQVQWPIQITNLNPYKINEDFFNNLLNFQLQPKLNKKYLTDLDEINHFLSNTLLCKDSGAILPQPQEMRTLQKSQMTEVDTAQAYLINPRASLAPIQFDFRWETLIRYCQNYLKGPDRRLTFDNLSTCDAIEKAVETLQTEAENLDPYISKTQRIKIQATCREIKASLTEARQRLTPKSDTTPEKEVLELIRKGLIRSGISLDKIEESRGILAWVLGEDFGDFIDALTMDKTKSAQPLIPLSISKKHPPSQMRKILFSTGFQAAVLLFKVGLLVHMSMTKLLALEINAWKKIAKTLWKQLPSHIKKSAKERINHISQRLPQPVRNAIAKLQALYDYLQFLSDQLISAACMTLLDLSTKMLLTILASSQKFKRVQTIGLHWRETLLNISRSLQDNKRLDYRLPPFWTRFPSSPKDVSTPVDESLIPLDSKQVKPGLSALSHFCPISQIYCWTKPNSQHLQRIDLAPYHLSFNIDSTKDTPRATNEEKFPGYAIATKQKNPSLKGFSSYLLLENASGQKKVLIPSDQWFSALAWNGLSRLGHYATFFHQWTSRIEQQSSAYFEYDLNEDGVLTSQNPGDLAYIIGIYLLQGNIEKAESACKQFEEISITQELPLNLSQQLVPMALVPATMANTSLIRRRLMAAIENNYQNYGKQKDKRSSDDTAIEDLSWALCLSEDLRVIPNELDPRRQISDDQEWFLYTAMIRRFQNMLKNFKDIKALIVPIEQLANDQLKDYFGFSPEMCTRFGVLKTLFTQGKPQIGQNKLLLSLTSDPEITRVDEKLHKVFTQLFDEAFDNSVPNIDNYEPSDPQLRNKESLWTLYINMQASHDKWQEEYKSDLQQILFFVNNKPDVQKLTINELMKYYEKGELDKLSPPTNLPAKHFEYLSFALEKFRTKSKRTAQMKHGIKLIQSLVNMSPQNPDYFPTIKSLADTLSI